VPQLDRAVVEQLASDLNVMFGDDWSTRAMNRLLTAIQSRSGGRLERGIHCYGLHLNRGIVTSGYRVRGIAVGNRGDGNYYGFPRIIRDARGEDWQRFMDEAGSDIARMNSRRVDSEDEENSPMLAQPRHSVSIGPPPISVLGDLHYSSPDSPRDEAPEALRWVLVPPTSGVTSSTRIR
jgi:hypothetical protein